MDDHEHRVQVPKGLERARAVKPNDYYVAEYERRIAEGMDRASAWDEVDDMMLADKRAERATRRQETQELRERVAQLEVQLALLERVR